MVWSRLLLVVCLSAYAQSAEKLEFDVASVKPSELSNRGLGCSGGPGTDDPGMFICNNMTLGDLVTLAYKIPNYQFSAPDWIQDVRLVFQVSCKIPPGTTRDQFNVMLQNLLADRFKLVVHRENRDYTTYQLVVVKNGPKFKDAADPRPAPSASERRPVPGPYRLDKDGYPILDLDRGGMAMLRGRGRMHYPQMTMQMLARQLSRQLRGPVTDSTRLTGKYAIDLYWVNQPMRDSADTEGPTLMQALQEQLGLRLELKKAPVEFLVVDHAEKVPTEN